jgi:MFS family permease
MDVNGYNLTFAVLLLTGAALGDRFGRRAMFAAGIFLFTLASMACALSGSVKVLIAARSAQGAGAALVMPLAMAILSGAFAKEERARALASSAPSPDVPSLSAPPSAASLPRLWDGDGSSGSIFRSPSPWCWRGFARASGRRPHWTFRDW